VAGRRSTIRPGDRQAEAVGDAEIAVQHVAHEADELHERESFRPRSSRIALRCASVASVPIMFMTGSPIELNIQKASAATASITEDRLQQAANHEGNHGERGTAAAWPAAQMGSLQTSCLRHRCQCLPERAHRPNLSEQTA
jgi:hypothetical protein